jgi:uncharacterized protein GlcG (DUF336 family)
MLRKEAATQAPTAAPRRVARVLGLVLAGAAVFMPWRSAASRASAAAALSAAEVDRIVQQAAAEAARLGLRAHVAVTDKEGNALALFAMDGAPSTSVVEGERSAAAPGVPAEGLEGLSLPAELVAITKAGTGALLSSNGNAFTSRTASFIVQQHFPPGVDFTPGGPLFGVQLSSLPCTDVTRPALPLGLAGDPGGLPLYKGGELVGGIGVEGDGRYGVDKDPASADETDDAALEEQAALAGTRGFETPELVRADRILADGIRLPFANVRMPGPAGGGAAGRYVRDALGIAPASPRDAPASALAPATLGGVRGQTDPRFPIRAGAALDAADVTRILEQAARQTVVTRAAIRQPLGSHARVSMAVVDLSGAVLGFFQNEEAPNFGIDVAVQKARTANFFSGPGAADDLRRLGLSRFVADGLALDGSVAFTSRAVGFLAQPLYPPGIENTAEGPFSVTLARYAWSPFNTGLQLELVRPALLTLLNTGRLVQPCNAPNPLRADGVSRLPNGITIFPGGVPLYKSGRLAGAVGISGDGVDQDDLIASAGATGFEAPEAMRCDRLVVRGARLPWVKFPRHPEL